MNELPLAYAFGAGLLAAVNPCGFAMLPSFVAYYLGSEEAGYPHAPVLARATQALALSGVVTAGFLAVFSLVGLVVAVGGRAVLALVPWLTLAIGLALVLLGVRLALGKTIHLNLPRVRADLRRKGPRAMFLYGVGYATVSLSCTLPIFLLVVAGALAREGALASLLMLVSYGLGMGAVLTAVAVGAALFKGAVARALRRALPAVERLSALLLVVGGLYLIYYQLTTTFGLTALALGG